MTSVCVFCETPLGDDETEKVTLHEKGFNTLNELIKARGDNRKVFIGQVVHKKCRRDYCRKKETYSEENKASRNEENDLKEFCLFCGTAAKLSEAKKRGYDVYHVRDNNFRTTINKIIGSRPGDPWAEEVEKRIQRRDLAAISAVYHQACNVNFRNNKQIPSVHGGKRRKKEGRPIDEHKNNAFQKLIAHIESHEGEAFLMSELSTIMERECDENGGFTTQYLKKKLLEHFGDDITIVSKNGCPDLILFRHSLEDIFDSIYEKKKNKGNTTENIRIVQTIAKMIKSDLTKMKRNKEAYPTALELSNLEFQRSLLPESLIVLLDEMFTEKNHDLKLVSIGQAIAQAVCPRSIIAPLQFGLGVQMHHNFCSRFLLDTLHKLGFCSSYSEVHKFELCAASTVKEIYSDPNQIIKFAADNVDHDPKTIDGKNTLHGMGLIAAITPQNRATQAVVRANRTIEDVRAIGTIEIKYYSAELKIDNGLCYNELPSLLYEDLHFNTDLLLKITSPIRHERPSWSGIMQTVHHGPHPGKSSLSILPIIDMNPSDPTCIYSTLHFVAKEAKKFDIDPIVAFDEPLWWKAYIIIGNEPVSSCLKSIVLMLGGFHLEMNFLGVIGYIMSGTGLQEVLETVYAANSVQHILSGKAVSRAVRAHFLVDGILNGFLMDAVKNDQDNSDELDGEWNSMICDAECLFDQLLSLDVSPADLESNELLLSIKTRMERFKSKLAHQNRTAKMWIQYMDMVDTLKNFLRSERTGNWKLHLKTIRKMLPFFAVSGHILYAKCAYLYLQKMAQLEETHPAVYKLFLDGHHVIRRSDRYWAALSCDLTIEQHLMRSIKSRKGLTRGRGVSEEQRLIWVQSMPECAEVNIAMQKLTDLYFETSEQHKDCSEARLKRDEEDLQILYEFLKDKNPFELEDKVLRNICNGMEASGNVNADNAESVGLEILTRMIGKRVSEYTFKKLDKAITMSDKSTIVIDGEVTRIDPQLLFQRLVLVAKNYDDQKLQKMFSFELCQRPSSIFDDYGMMREANRETFGDKISKIVKAKTCEDTIPDEINLRSYKHIISGDWLINTVPWKKNESFSQIFSKYALYVEPFNNPVIIFNTYELDTSIMDECIFRRTKGAQGVNYEFTANMLLNVKKESFLASKSNKRRFIKMLGETLTESGCSIAYKSENASVVIAQTAVVSTESHRTAVVGDDIEILSLLCQFYKESCEELIFRFMGSKPKIWNIKRTTKALGKDICRHILFLDAIDGCYTTSHLFGVGKGVPLAKYEKHSELADFAEVFYTPNVPESEIIEAGNKALILLYNGKQSDSLDSLRYRRYLEKISLAKSVVLVQSLPPTSASAKYHILRVYLQMQKWLGNEKIRVDDYGWMKNGQKLQPITTDKEPAPLDLLITIRCKCKGTCSNNRCTCRRNQLKCSSACSECKGTNCFNRYIVTEDDISGD